MTGAARVRGGARRRRSIKINLTPRERTLLATPRAVDPAAYEAYSKGRYLWDNPTEENLTKSREYFEQAIEKKGAGGDAGALAAKVCSSRLCRHGL